MNYRGHELFHQSQIFRPKGGTPLDVSCVYGIDTESFRSIQLQGLHTAMVQTADDTDEYCDEPKLNESPFHFMIDRAFDRHSVEMTGKLAKSNTQIHRSKGLKSGGRPQIPMVLFTFYNLEYDMQRLFKPNSPFFDMARINIEGIKITIDGYEIENVHMVLNGSAPHFTWILRKQNRILKMYAIDLWGYLKEGLGVSAKALGVVDKISIDKNFFHIPLEELTEKQLDELRIYGKRDPRVTRQLYLTLLDLLMEFSSDVVTARGILPPSAPAAAARIAFSKMKGDFLRQSPKWAVQIALESYSGGLVFSRVKGQVSNILVGDRNSAYPTMMTLLPDPEKVKYSMVSKPSMNELIGKIGFCRASFEHVSDYIPFVTTYDGTMKSNHAKGRYSYQSISIYELAAGYLMGQITHITVHEAVFLVFDEDAKNSGFLYDFVKKYHGIKNENEKGSPLYLLAKLLMNSLYGKLIEMRSAESLIIPNSIAKLHVPSSWIGLLKHDKSFKKIFYHSLVNHGLDFDEIIMDYPPLENDTFITVDKVVESMDLNAGSYFFPFYASLITAGQRAWMSVYTYFVKAYLADTDSAFTALNRNEFVAALKKADKITQRIGVGRCQVGKELGDIDVEIENANGYIAGIKQYAIASTTKKKIAHHAIVAPTINKLAYDFSSIDYQMKPTNKTVTMLFDSLVLTDNEIRNEFFTEVIKNLSQNITVSYLERSRPVKMRTSLLRGKDYGKFESGIRTITPKDDTRMRLIKRGKLSYFEWKSVITTESSKLTNETEIA